MNNSNPNIAKPTLMVAFVRTEDQEKMNEIYLSKAVKMVEKHQGKTVAVSDSPIVLEGEFPKGRMVILEFPTLEHAQGFYNDPDYQPLKQARRKISDSDSVLIECL